MPVTISVNDVVGNKVLFTGNVKFTEPNRIKFGVSYYPEESSDKKMMYEIREVSNDGTFNVTLSGLLSNTIYTWKYYLSQNGKITEYVASTFATEDPYIIPSNQDAHLAIDLSDYATAT